MKRDFAPVALVALSPQMLVVHPSFPAATVNAATNSTVRLSGQLSACLARAICPVIVAHSYRENTSRKPSSISASCGCATLPIRSVRKDLSTVSTCETLTTEGLLRRVPRVGIRTLPGASARRKFEVTTAATTVLMRLALKLSDEMMSSGRRNPGPDPAGSGSDAHHSSPRRTFRYAAWPYGIAIKRFQVPAWTARDFSRKPH